MDRYYDDGTGTNAVCQSCQYTCGTCSIGTECVACNALKYRVYDAVSKLCTCMDGYYDDGTSTN